MHGGFVGLKKNGGLNFGIQSLRLCHPGPARHTIPTSTKKFLFLKLCCHCYRSVCVDWKLMSDLSVGPCIAVAVEEWPQQCPHMAYRETLRQDFQFQLHQFFPLYE
jgi:hypothetical protein